jgi:hypothetical protein
MSCTSRCSILGYGRAGYNTDQSRFFCRLRGVGIGITEFDPTSIHGVGGQGVDASDEAIVYRQLVHTVGVKYTHESFADAIAGLRLGDSDWGK